jgi:site-specific DNA recombinase
VPLAALYLRQSLDRSGQRAAVQRQLEACLALCSAKGYEVYGEPYEDNDTSASSLKPRKHYLRMLADAEAGKFDVIVVHHIDRLARRVRDLEDVLDIGLPIATAVGDMDLSNDMGRLVARILNAVAVGEVERKAARQKAGNKQRAAQGVPHAGPPPFGYRREVQRNEDGKLTSATLVEEPAEADAVRDGYRLLLAGATLKGIASEWNKAGLLTSVGGEWTGWSVRRRLKSPAYAGFTSYDGEQVGIGNWTPLVSEDTWRAAVELLNSEDRRTTMDQTRRYLLPGLALCGVDGCTLKVATGRSHRGVRTYVCQSKHMARAAEPVDSMITRLVIARLSRPDAHKLLHDDKKPESERWRERAQALRSKLDSAALAWAEDRLNDSQFNVTNEKLRADLAEAESKISYSSRADVLGDLVGTDVATVWESLHLDRQRAVISALLTITLQPPGRGKKRFEPDSVRVAWK